MHRLFCAALAAAVFVLLAAPAQASGWYATAFGGANWHSDYGGEGPKAQVSIEPDVGYVAGVALGRTISGGLRAELEVSYRDNAHTGLFDACADTPLYGHDSTFATMLNVAYDFDLGAVKPYVLAGVGYNARRISVEPVPDNWAANGYGSERQGVAYQFGAGANYALSERASVGLGYRYFAGSAINREMTVGGKYTFLEANGYNHGAIASVTLALN